MITHRTQYSNFALKVVIPAFRKYGSWIFQLFPHRLANFTQIQIMLEYRNIFPYGYLNVSLNWKPLNITNKYSNQF
jgi:hypothetical protein